MMLTNFKTCILLCALPVSVGMYGGRVVMSQKFLDYAVGKTLPLLENAMRHLHIPDVSGKKDDIQYAADSIKISSLSCSSTALTFSAGEGFALDFRGISLHGSLHWMYKATYWPHVPFGSGSADIRTGGNSYIRATVVALIVNKRPQFALQGLDVHLDSFNIDVHGSMMSKLYNLIVNDFNNHIRNKIEDMLGSVLTSEMSTLNRIVSAYAFTEDLPLPAPYDRSAIDFTITNMSVEADRLTADAKGQVFPTDSSSRYSGIARAIPRDAFHGSHHFQLEVNSYIFDSAFYTYTKQGLLQYLIGPDDIPRSCPVQLRTADFALLAPGLLRWSHANMSILADTRQRDTTSPDAVSFVNDTVVASFPGSFAFHVLESGLSGPAFVLSCPLHVEAQVSVQEASGTQVMHFSVSKASCAPLTVNSSIVGPVSAVGFSAILRIVLDLVIPRLNKGISKGVPLPNVAGVSLVNTTVTADLGKLEVKTDVELEFGAVASTHTWPASGEQWHRPVVMFV